MKALEDRIRKDGLVKEGNVLKVDSFLNHQMDVCLFHEMGDEWARLFADKPINKILTIEASGIGIACVAAECFNVPVVFAPNFDIHGRVFIVGNPYKRAELAHRHDAGLSKADDDLPELKIVVAAKRPGLLND